MTCGQRKPENQWTGDEIKAANLDQRLKSHCDFQDSPDDEEDIKSSHEYQNDLEKEYQAITLLAKSKRFFKKEIETLSLDDLFNKLKAYESEVMGTSSSTLNSHNVDFLSSSSTNSTTRAFNTAQGVDTASTQGAADISTTVEN
nr:hypothetical protein [Tanacetum cinerariifolium]